MFNDLKLYLIVRFVDIGEIVEYHMFHSVILICCNDVLLTVHNLFTMG